MESPGLDLTQVPAPIPAERGPERSAFPAEKLMTPDVAERILTGGALARTASGDPVVLVPLVFDEAGYLHSARSFNATLDSLLRAQPPESQSQARLAGSGEELDVAFTDYETFQEVVGGAGARRSGPSYAHLYAAGTFGRVPAARDGLDAARLNGGSTGVYDPYTCDERTAIECPADPTSGGGGFTERGTGIPHVGPTISWPELWVGDIISGEVDGGWLAGWESGILGHTSIVTDLSSFQNEGGVFESDNTLVFEAIGKKDPVEDEILERPATMYWGRDGSHRSIHVRYHPDASWDQRARAVEYAMAQDDDIYLATTSKINRTRWYCSKLVWRAYREATGDDLDVDWGYFVFPDNIERSHVLETAYYYFRPTS